jgi:hypothetical protein
MGGTLLAADGVDQQRPGRTFAQTIGPQLRRRLRWQFGFRRGLGLRLDLRLGLVAMT